MRFRTQFTSQFLFLLMNDLCVMTLKKTENIFRLTAGICNDLIILSDINEQKKIPLLNFLFIFSRIFPILCLIIDEKNCKMIKIK